MGNCCKHTPPTQSTLPKYNIHSHTTHNLRFGVMGEKTPDGEIHIGMKCTVDRKKDAEYSRVNGNAKNNQQHVLPLRSQSI